MAAREPSERNAKCSPTAWFAGMFSSICGCLGDKPFGRQRILATQRLTMLGWLTVTNQSLREALCRERQFSAVVVGCFMSRDYQVRS